MLEIHCRKEKNEILRFLHETYNLETPLIDLYKYSLLISLENSYILAIYKPNNKTITKFLK